MALNGWTRVLLLLLALAGCGGSEQQAAPKDAGLEAAAIRRGLVRGPGDVALSGIFAHDTDRICIVDRQIGVTSDVGEGLRCAASGEVKRRGDRLDIILGSAGDCRFEAQYDGDRIEFPVRLAEGCARFCTGNATLSAVRVERLSSSVAEAGAMRDFRNRFLCPTEG